MTWDRGTSSRAGGRPGGVVAGALVLAVALLAGGPAAPAAAHDELLSSDPSEAGIIEALPSRAILTFTGAVRDVHEITVTGPDGSVVNGAPTAVGMEVRQNLWAGPDGDYTLTYDVVSGDGHEMAGQVQFQVGAGAEPGVDEVSAPTSSSSGDDDTVRGVVVPVTLVLSAAAVALVVLRRRRTASGT